MAYDQELVRRVRILLAGKPGLDEKKMFGGVGYMLHGNMVCGVLNDSLIVRVGAEKYQDALDKAHTRLFDTRGRAMKGWVMVDPPGWAADESLAEWVRMCVDYVSSLPPK